MSTDSPTAGPSFATSDEEAADRFARTRGKDPFPEIHPALLNTADLLDYVAETGMIYPFEVPPSDRSELLKPASCGIRLAGDYVYWDTGPDGEPLKVEGTLISGEDLVLKKNSIVYVTLEPMLRLPDYIAARFNLTIRDIYRGILVGTGPLVDPGFTGRLSLPLHNLTFNDYPIKAGEPIVWMEFTKISSNEDWAGPPGRVRRGAYERFPKRKKKRRNVHDYLLYAYPGPITSSIPPLLGEANASAAAAASAVKRQQRIFATVSIPTAVIIVLAMAAVLLQVVALVNDSNNDRKDLTRQVDALTREVKELKAAKKPKASRATSATGG